MTEDNVVPLPGATKPKNRGNAVRKYPEDVREKAVELYRTSGPTEVYRQMKILPSTVCRWADAAGVSTIVAPRTLAARDAWVAKSAELREQARYLAHERAVEMLERMSEPYEEYVGQFGTRVVYDRPPAPAVNQFAAAFGKLIDKIRLEEGRSTSNVAVDFRARVERIAAEMGLDPDEVMAEAEALALETGDA